jgi:hypothetical protein
MSARFQLVIDCKDSELLARFRAAALGYVLEPPPAGSLPGMAGRPTGRSRSPPAPSESMPKPGGRQISGPPAPEP